jgi:hypothetical protein
VYEGRTAPKFSAFPDGSAWIRTERFRRMTTSREPEFAFHALS